MLPAVTTQKATLKPYLEEIRQWVEQWTHRYLDRAHAELDPGEHLGLPVAARHPAP